MFIMRKEMASEESKNKRVEIGPMKKLIFFKECWENTLCKWNPIFQEILQIFNSKLEEEALKELKRSEMS